MISYQSLIIIFAIAYLIYRLIRYFGLEENTDTIAVTNAEWFHVGMRLDMGDGRHCIVHSVDCINNKITISELCRDLPE